MKRIEATIPPFKLDEVRDALLGAGAEGMTMTEVKVLDPHGRTACYRGATFEIPFSARCKVEVVVPADRVARCVDAVRAHSVDAVDVIIQSLDDSVQIRTGAHVSRAA